MAYTLVLKFIKNESSLSSDYIITEVENQKITLKPNTITVTFQKLVDLLSADVQRKIEGKIVSYYHVGYQAYVFLGCTPEKSVQA